MHTEFDLAHYFECLEGPFVELSKVRLNCLLYFTQGWTLALLNRPMFNRDIQAWLTGPTMPNLLEDLRRMHPLFNKEDWSEDEQEIVSTVFRTYGNLSDKTLLKLAMDSDPYLYARAKSIQYPVISHEQMQRYFANLAE